MNKKEYEKPAMRVIMLQQQAHLLTGSGNGPLISTKTNLGDDDFIFDGGGDGTGILEPR